MSTPRQAYKFYPSSCSAIATTAPDYSPLILEHLGVAIVPKANSENRGIRLARVARGVGVTLRESDDDVDNSGAESDSNIHITPS